MRQKNGLAFTVVSDPGNVIASRLGILTRPSPETRATDTLSMPATAILDAARTIRWIDVHPDYPARTEPEQVGPANRGQSPATAVSKPVKSSAHGPQAARWAATPGYRCAGSSPVAARST